MNINHNQNNKQKLIWSSLRHKLNISLHEQNLLTFLNIQDVQTRLEKFLSFYTDGNKDQDLDNNLKFLNHYNVEPGMKDFITSLAECLNMTKNNCFEFLDNYFYLNKEEYKKLSIVINLFTSYGDKSSRQYQNVIIDLEDKRTKIIEFYFKERKNLILFYLDLFFKIFLELDNTPMRLRNFMDNFIRTKKLLEVLYKQLISYERITDIFDRNKLNNQNLKEIIYKVPIYICEEQNLILELIMILLNEGKYNDPTVFAGLFEYFLKTHFYCFCQNLNIDNNILKDQIMTKCLLITLSNFQPSTINKILEGETNKINDLQFLKNNFNFTILYKIYDQPINNHVLLPIKLTLNSVIEFIKKNRNTINNSNNIINSFSNLQNKDFEERECFGFLNLLDQKIQILEEEYHAEKELTIYDIYYNILYDWLNMVMGLYYEEIVDRYPPLMYSLLFRVLSHYLPQRKFYENLFSHKNNHISNFFKSLKQEDERKDIFLKLCFSLSKSIEPGEGNDNNDYLLHILSIDPIDELKRKLSECEGDFQEKKNLIEDAEREIFFYNIFEEWNNLIQELFQYSQQFQNQIQGQEALPDELKNQINYIRLFIRSVLPGDSFSNFIFNYTYYLSLKERTDFNENNINNMDEDINDIDLGIQSYNPEIFKKLIFNSITVLSLITELQIQNKNILFGEFITELLKLFILYTKDSHFTECLRNMNFFFEKFNGKNIIYNIIANDNNTQDFSNTLYAIRFIKEMFKPDIFLTVSRNSDYNTPAKYGEIFYVTNFYYIKELINHFTQINEFLTPLNALLIAELGDIMTQIMNYLEFKINNHKIEILEAQNNIIYDNKNLVNFVIKLLMQDNKEYVIEDENRQNGIGSGNLLLLDFIFKFIGIKINDDGVNNLNINEGRKNIIYNNSFVQMYLDSNKGNINSESANNSYNMSCYKKMILSSLNCLNKILSLILILNKKKDTDKENQNIIYKYNNISFINKLNYKFIEAKEIPHYIYESIDDKRKYNLNIILLLFFYSLYEVEKNEQIVNLRKYIFDLEEDEPSDLEFFVGDLKPDSHLNVSTLSLNTLSKIIYIIKDTGININNYFTLEKITSTDLNTNINLFKFIRNKIIDILGSANQDIDLIKIEILKLLIISTKYQHSFIRDFIHGDDDIHHNDILFTNLNNSLKLSHNYDDNNINNNEDDDPIKIEGKNPRSELFTYITMFISELLNETQDIKIIESLLIKGNGIILMNNLIYYGINACKVTNNYNDFNSKLVKYLNSFDNNISDILILSNNFQISLNVLSLKLNIIRSLAIIFKRILLFCKKTKKLKIDFKYSKKLKYFIQTHVCNLVDFYSKGNDYDFIKTIKNIQKDMIINGVQLKQKYLSDNDNMNKDNLEMIIENYLYKYDYNFSFDIKELIVKGFYDNMFREKHLKKVVINNCFVSYHYILVQTLTQIAHLFGLIFSIGEYNYLLTNKLFSNPEIYKIFKDSANNNQLSDSYIEEINSILKYDNCYNYKLTFNPLADLFNNDINSAIAFLNDVIIDKCINVQNIPNLTLNEHRLYCQMLNCSLDYIIYLHNKSISSPNRISAKLYLFEFLKKVNSVISEGVANNEISDNNLLSVFNLIYHIVYYMVLTEETFDPQNQDEENENEYEIKNNDNNNNEKVQVIIELMEVLIMIFKKIKECRSIILYIFSCIVYIKNDSIKNSIIELFNIIVKLYTKENDSFEFHSFLLLLNRLKINYPVLLMDILKEPQIFNFIAIKCGYNSDINLYDNQMHTSGHLIYCWTLKMFSNILSTYSSKISTELKPNYNIVISNTMKFIELIQPRFKALFSISSNNDNFLSGLNQSNFITLAYLNELKASIEFITSFITIECENSTPITKDQSFLEFLFDTVDFIANTCLHLFKNGYKNISNLCKPNSKLEKLMLNTKLTTDDFNENNNIINLNLNLNSQFSFGNNNIYKNLINSNDNNINNNIQNNNYNFENGDSTLNVFYFKVKSNLIMILFHISSCMIQLLNRQNFNIKQYFFNKYQLKENEAQLNTWPMNYLYSIKFSANFLKDIIMNLKKYKILYNKSVILLNSSNISLGNCFINELDVEYPLNELVDLILFILNDFCILSPNFKDFIELIIKNHPYINNNRAILGDLYQLTRNIKNEIERYSRDFDKEDNFIDDFTELRNNVDNVNKNLSYKNKF